MNACCICNRTQINSFREIYLLFLCNKLGPICQKGRILLLKLFKNDITRYILHNIFLKIEKNSLENKNKTPTKQKT